MLGADAPLPLTLPWYFVAFLVGVWLAVVWAFAVIAARRLRERRRHQARRARGTSIQLP